MSSVGRRLVQHVRDLAQLAPRFVYVKPEREGATGATAARCVYVHDGEPSCLIGQALWREKLIGPELERDPGNGSTAGSILSNVAPELGGAEREWLSAVQIHQDTGATWSAAVASADAAFAQRSLHV